MRILNYKELGEGEPVIILHGLLGMLDNWKTFARKLAEEYWVILVDQRNHGKSFHDPTFNYDVLADDLNVLMEQLYIPRAHLIGHSMGGKTVMRFSDSYMDKVDKAIVVDIAPSGSIGSHSLIFETLLETDLSQVRERGDVEQALRAKGIERDVALFLMKNLKRDKTTGGFVWKANIPALWESYEQILASVVPAQPLDVDVLFVAGGESGYITPKDYPIIDNSFPDHERRIIDGAGHWVHAEKPFELLAVVRDFLEDDLS